MNKVMHKINSSFSIYTYISIALCSATLLSTILLSSSIVSADTDSTDTVSLTVPIACTMTGEGTSHTATLDPGTYSGATDSEYKNGIGKTTLTAICNDDNGFSIYAIGYTGNSYDSENHTKLVGSTTGGTISTKAYASEDTTSNWSMKLTKITDSAESYNPQNLTIQSDTEGTFSNWHSIPSAYTKVAEYHANTGSSATDTTLGVKLETTYAAYISSSQPADTYVGQVKYTMVHPYTEAPLQPQTTASGKICYYPNGSNVDGTMGCQTIPTSGTTDDVSPTSATLLASNFSRTGYGFAGWSNKFDYATNPNQEGIKFYGPQETITFTVGEYTGNNNGLALYAVWVKSQGSIQDQDKVANVCSSLTTAPTDGTANLSSVSAFTDSRDNNTYAIAKLADGKCWMIENLRLEAEDTRTPEKQVLAQGYGTSATFGNFSGLANAENANFSTSTTANSLYYSGTQSGSATIDIGTTYGSDHRMPRYNNYNHKSNSTDRPQNPTANSDINSTTNASLYSYGNYYTWHAAIADLTYNGTNNISSSNTSLCPKGWHLPTGGLANSRTVNVTGQPNTFRDYYNLGYTIMGSTTTAYEDTPHNGYAAYSDNTTNTSGDTATKAFRKYPNNFLYSGGFYTSSASYRGVLGNYWSSTATMSTNVSYILSVNSVEVRPGTEGFNKFYGFSIRCMVSAGT